MINEELQTSLLSRQSELEQRQAQLLQVQAEIEKSHLGDEFNQEFNSSSDLLQHEARRVSKSKGLDAFMKGPFKKEPKSEEEIRHNRIVLTPSVQLEVFEDIDPTKFWEILDPVIQKQLKTLPAGEPQVSIITPTFESSLDWFAATALSVLNQSTSNWEWCIVDDGSTSVPLRQILPELAHKHPNIKVKLQASGGISSATNHAINLASGKYICFLDHDDTLAETALQESIRKLSEGFDIVYSDEDKIDTSGLHYIEPFFKPDWSPEYFRGVMYVGHLLCVRRDLALAVGGLRSEYDGVQDYDFMLRLSEINQGIGHIPKVLYHWRKIEGSIAQKSDAKPKIESLQQASVDEHLKRLNLPATAKQVGNHRLSIIPLTRKQNPLVSIIIPTKNAPEHLSRCLESIFSFSSYLNFEVLLIDNETTDPKALNIMRQFPVKRIFLPNPFNYSHANNLGAEYAQGDYLLFLNNDTEVVSQDWLQNLLYYASQKDVGAVGALLLFPNKTVQHAGVVLGCRGTADHLMRGFPESSDGYAGSLKCAREVSAVTGACMMIKKEQFYEAGAFNEHFFTHYQDVDLCMRLLRSNKRIIFTPRSVLIHYESITRKEYYDMVDRVLLLDQWQAFISSGDPYYNPNLDVAQCDYGVRV
ncbi:MAG: glycosyltransferase family 2 protein [Cyanothece sp. SIO1E1]|nr:glycosyltransferase family 2 protein [Cyanothece sp. SIO1E1]